MTPVVPYEPCTLERVKSWQAAPGLYLNFIAQEHRGKYFMLVQLADKKYALQRQRSGVRLFTLEALGKFLVRSLGVTRWEVQADPRQRTGRRADRGQG